MNMDEQVPRLTGQHELDLMKKETISKLSEKGYVGQVGSMGRSWGCEYVQNILHDIVKELYI